MQDRAIKIRPDDFNRAHALRSATGLTFADVLGVALLSLEQLPTQKREKLVDRRRKERLNKDRRLAVAA